MILEDGQLGGSHQDGGHIVTSQTCASGGRPLVLNVKHTVEHWGQCREKQNVGLGLGLALGAAQREAERGVSRSVCGSGLFSRVW